MVSARGGPRRTAVRRRDGVRLDHDRSRTAAVDRVPGDARLRGREPCAGSLLGSGGARDRVCGAHHGHDHRSPAHGENAGAHSVRAGHLMLANVVLVFLWVGITAYVLLGGADFGAGFWDLLAGSARRGAEQRHRIEESIGPVWEANHVWLIFALVVVWTGFPAVFAAIASTLYIPLTAAGHGQWRRHRELARPDIVARWHARGRGLRLPGRRVPDRGFTQAR